MRTGRKQEFAAEKMCFDPLNKFENLSFVTTEEGFMMFAKIEAGIFLIENPPKLGEFTVIAIQINPTIHPNSHG